MKRSCDLNEELFTIVVRNEDDEDKDIYVYRITVDFEKDGIHLNWRLSGEEFFIDVCSQVKNKFLEWSGAYGVKENSTISISQIDGYGDKVICFTVTYYESGDMTFKKSILADLGL